MAPAVSDSIHQSVGHLSEPVWFKGAPMMRCPMLLLMFAVAALITIGGLLFLRRIW